MAQPKNQSPVKRLEVQQKEEHQAWPWFSGGVGLGGGVAGASAAGLMIQPWICGVLWACAFGLTSRGIWLSVSQLSQFKSKRLSNAVATLGLALALVIAGTLWLETSPRAELRLVTVEFPEYQGPGIRFRVIVENVGKYEAITRSMSQSQLLPGEVGGYDDVEKRRAYEAHLQQTLDDAPDHNVTFPITPGYKHGFETTYPVNDHFKAMWKSGQATFYIVDQFRYRDWWFWERRYTVCVANIGHPQEFRGCLYQQ